MNNSATTPEKEPVPATAAMRPGPGLSLQQKIGDIARSALWANKPENWNLGESTGDDFGYDFQAIAFDPCDQGAQCAFSIQLKGTTQRNHRLADCKHLSYPFDVTTLNLWHRSGFAVVLVVADLIDTRDPKIANVYYHFVSYDLDEILEGLKADQKSVHIRIPIVQLVHTGLDILPVVLPYLDELREARIATRNRRRTGGTASADRISLGLNPSTPGVSVSDISAGDDIELLIASSTRKVELTAALAALRAGDYDRVLALCPEPKKQDCDTSPIDSGLSAHLRSISLETMGFAGEGEKLSFMALSLLPQSDSVVATAFQRQLNALEMGESARAARLALLDKLKGHEGPYVACLKAKLFSLNGDFDLAREVLATFPVARITPTNVVISTIERSWNRTLEEIASCREIPNLRPRQRLWLEVLEARAHFELALRNITRPTAGDLIIPSSGLPGIDYAALRLAYEASYRAMISAQRQNWPIDIKMALDVFPLSAMLLGYESEAMPLIASLGNARSVVTEIREVVSKMAIQFDQPEIALKLGEARKDSPRFANEDALMAVAAIKAGQPERALAQVTDDFLDSDADTDVYYTSLVMLGIAADSTLQNDTLKRITKRLARDVVSRHYAAILEAALAAQQNLLQRADAIAHLFEYWKGNDFPVVVGFHILTNSDTQRKEEAETFVSVAQKLEHTNSLGSEQQADLGQALITLGRFAEAVTRLTDAASRFRDNPRILSLLGIALELDGQSAAAFNLFEKLLEDGKASETARRCFVEIAVRMGFIERAEQQVRTAYAKATTRERKLRLLNTLFQLLLMEGDSPKQTEEVAWQYGQQASQSNEREEGLFLQQYMLATARAEVDIGPERIEEFQRRLSEFVSTFPKSRYLRQATLPADGPPEKLLSVIQEVAGVSDEAIQKGNETELRMNRGALQVPFSWRPRRYLRNFSDVFMLWEIRKEAPIDIGSMHFNNGASGYPRNVPDNMRNCEAVLSLTSLLVLDELSLLSLVLDAFPKIVIARSTLETVQSARGTIGGGWGHEKSKRIIDLLQGQFAKISHPAISFEKSVAVAPDWHHEEKRAMAVNGRVYFSDDIVETYLVCGEPSGKDAALSVSTVEFLKWADQSAKIVSPALVADALGHMVRLRIQSISIEQRYLLAAIPAELYEAESKTNAEAIYGRAETLKSILDGVWDHFKPFEELRVHFGTNLAYLLNETTANEEVLVALWIRWLQTVRFQSDLKVSPTIKLTIAFLTALEKLKPQKSVVERLWNAFWTTLRRGLSSELKEAEDVTGVHEVADMLGRWRANPKSEPVAIELFERARLGLVDGTAQDALFSKTYLNAMVKKLQEKK